MNSTELRPKVKDSVALTFKSFSHFDVLFGDDANTKTEKMELTLWRAIGVENVKNGLH